MSKYLMVCGRADCPRPYGFCEACVRAEERERIAQAIEAHGAHLRISDEPVILRSVAARIARNGGVHDR